jgi:signal transduction histidine kinase
MAKRKNDAGATGPCRHAARLETMANLARPVQHEINNLLTVIFANLEMLKRTAAEGAPQRQLDRVAEAARRFEASSRGFLSLSRRPVPGVSVFALEEALVAVRPLLVVLMPTPSVLAVEPGTEGWPVRMDRALLDEALIALAREAGEALPRGGVLTLSSSNRPGPPEVAELAMRWPAEVRLPALEPLRGIARDAGGRVEEETADGTALLRLGLPRSTAAPE